MPTDTINNNFYVVDDDWIPATATFNFMMKEPLLDYFNYHVKASGVFKKNHKVLNKIVDKLPSKSKGILQENTCGGSFVSYIMEQGMIFEKKVMKLLTKKFTENRICKINGGASKGRDPSKVIETFEAMNQGIPFIHGGVLHNLENKTFGVCDLLVRSDWLKYLVNSPTDSPISLDDEMIKAPDLDGNWHYRVVDIKFSSLQLRADGIHLLNSGTFPAYKSQLFIYNKALKEMQGYEPPCTYILGRRWKYSTRGDTFSGFDCFDKLGTINYDGVDNDYPQSTEDALKWIRKVKSPQASKWNILKYPLKFEELYPNMSNRYDHPWHSLKKVISSETKELTSLWNVGPKNRSIALSEGINNWMDPKLDAKTLGINGNKISGVLDKIIDINRSPKDKILPKIVSNNFGMWKDPNNVEFFVDFETSNAAMFSIKKIPFARTENFIFMIGVGYISNGKFIYKDFTVDKMTFDEEERICNEFIEFINSSAKGPISMEVSKSVKAKCFHWAPAEDTVWRETMRRHPLIKNSEINWIDMLEIFKKEPIVIKGALTFCLKDVATAMFKHGFIQTSWDSSSECVDGQTAMVVVNKVHMMAKELKVSMKQIPIMHDIIKYNKVDVQVLCEILSYLRDNHTEKMSFTTLNQMKKRKYISHNNNGNDDKSKKIII